MFFLQDIKVLTICLIIIYTTSMPENQNMKIQKIMGTQLNLHQENNTISTANVIIFTVTRCKSNYIIVCIATATSPNYSGGSPCQSSITEITVQYFTSQSVQYVTVSVCNCVQHSNRNHGPCGQVGPISWEINPIMTLLLQQIRAEVLEQFLAAQTKG